MVMFNFHGTKQPKSLISTVWVIGVAQTFTSQFDIWIIVLFISNELYHYLAKQ